MSVIRRRIAALLSLPALALLTIGCGDVREQTQVWREPPHGTSATAGEVVIRNALVVTDSQGNATLYASFANHGDTADALTGVVVGGTETSPVGGEINLPVGSVTSVSPDNARVDVSEFDVEPGRLVDIQFVFANAPRTTVEAIVQPNEGSYADVTF
jgi:hypothetical protein